MFEIWESDVTLDAIEVSDSEFQKTEILHIVNCDRVDMTNIKIHDCSSESELSMIYISGSTFDFEDSEFDNN